MSTVVVLATGGTIATRTDAQGKSVARAAGAELVAGLGMADVDIEVDDVFRVGSYLMSLERMQQLADSVKSVADRPDVTGVVVTHGTDTLEESALFLDLFLNTDVPVVLTGAQRPADAPDSDGPRNLADAVRVAADPASRGRGPLVVFDGTVLAARGTQKVQTVASGAFGSPNGGPLGWIHGGEVHYAVSRPRVQPLDLSRFDPSRARVDIVACYPGADATALWAFADAGARGIVLEATGAGNANNEICDAVRDLIARGLVVATSTRVSCGPVAAIYGDGGGADLLKAGSVPMGMARPSQARVLLAALLGVYGDADHVRATVPVYLS